MKKTKTARGFALINFKDANGEKCSIQKSSAMEDDFIWFGVDDANPQILHGRATEIGIKHNANCGWVPYPIHEGVNLTTRMHLNREQVEKLLPILKKFVKTGEL